MLVAAIDRWRRRIKRAWRQFRIFIHPLPTAQATMCIAMRDFARGGGTGFMTVQTKSRGSVPIWIEDINKCATDEELLALIRKCISE